MSAFSHEKLKRMRHTMAGFVDRGEIPAIVTGISRQGEVHFEAYGEGISDDAIFRVASMTKPVVAVAAMILVEECRITLDEPVDRWLPELADRKVLRSLESAVEDTVPADRPLSLRDLLTYRSGHGMLMAMPGTYPIQAAIEAQFGPPGPPKPQNYPIPDEWLRRLGTLPLMNQPGERWLYHIPGEILGILVARIAGQSLGSFLKERIFDPLGMKDTGFYVPPDKTDRFTDSHWVNYQTGKQEVFDPAVDGDWTSPPPFESGGGGLVSSAGDFIKFGQMMLAGEGEILSRPSVELMTMNHLTPEQQVDGAAILDGRGWGFGTGVLTSRTDLRSTGTYGWEGGLGTSWLADPSEDLTAVLLTNQAMTSPVAPPVYDNFWTSTYASLVG